MVVLSRVSVNSRPKDQVTVLLLKQVLDEMIENVVPHSTAFEKFTVYIHHC